MSEYKSSTLKCSIDDDGCPVCRFLNGDRSGGILMAVIKTLDKSLADSENRVETLLSALVK